MNTKKRGKRWNASKVIGIDPDIHFTLRDYCEKLNIEIKAFTEQAVVYCMNNKFRPSSVEWAILPKKTKP